MKNNQRENLKRKVLNFAMAHILDRGSSHSLYMQFHSPVRYPLFHSRCSRLHSQL